MRILILVVAVLFFSRNSFAQKPPTQPPKKLPPPSDWITFQNHQNDEISEFKKKINDEKQAYLAAHQDAAAYINQQQAAYKAQVSARPAPPPRKAVVYKWPAKMIMVKAAD